MSEELEFENPQRNVDDVREDFSNRISELTRKANEHKGGKRVQSDRDVEGVSFNAPTGGVLAEIREYGTYVLLLFLMLILMENYSLIGKINMLRLKRILKIEFGR